MKKIPVLSFFLLLLLGISGCKKSYDHYTISDNFRTWLDYRRGSYWIFKSENSGKTDSTSVWERTSSTSDAEKGDGYYYDYIDLKLKSQFLHEIYLRGNAGYESAAITTNKADFPEAFRSGGVIDQVIIWNKGIYQELEPLDTLVLNTRNFYNVRHTRMEGTLQGDTIIREYFFSRYIGVVKFRQKYKSTDSTWTLVRWSVSQ
jgi:hypothetical protein